jgi:hypothetical protein
MPQSPHPLAPDELAREFDMFMARAGLTVPPARRAPVLASYADFRAQIALLHGRHEHTDEPAHVFSLPPSGSV